MPKFKIVRTNLLKDLENQVSIYANRILDFEHKVIRLENEKTKLEKQIKKKDEEVDGLLKSNEDLKKELQIEKDKSSKTAMSERNKEIALKKKWLGAYPGEEYEPGGK